MEEEKKEKFPGTDPFSSYSITVDSAYYTPATVISSGRVYTPGPGTSTTIYTSGTDSFVTDSTSRPFVPSIMTVPATSGIGAFISGYTPEQQEALEKKERRKRREEKKEMKRKVKFMEGLKDVYIQAW